MNTEAIARAVCKAKGINPDATGFATTDDTRNKLGDTYKLWEYQALYVELILDLAANEA